MKENTNTISPTMDPGIAELIKGLEVETANDMLEAARQAGIVPTEAMIAQARMLAGTGVRALIRRVQVIKVQVTELDSVIAASIKAHEADFPNVEVSERGRFFDNVGAPELVEASGQAMIETGLARIDTMTGEGATSYIATIFALPAVPSAPPAPPPAIAAPSRILRP